MEAVYAGNAVGCDQVNGTLYGIGVGPGDPELITLKAHRILQACPVVAYPAPDDAMCFECY